MPPPAPLVLVAATYDELVPSVTLGFDRPIDVSGLIGTDVLVRDGDALQLLLAATGGHVMQSATSVQLMLETVEGDATPGVVLTATPANGIVAVDDGGAWDGASELPLPWP